MNTEVECFDIPDLSSCFERAKQKKLFVKYIVKYIEVLETTLDGSVRTVIKGRKEDLKTLPLKILIADRFEQRMQRIPHVWK